MTTVAAIDRKAGFPGLPLRRMVFPLMVLDTGLVKTSTTLPSMGRPAHFH